MYFRPRTLEEAVHVLGRHGGRLLAGGTDVFPSLGDRPLSGTVIDLSLIPDLGGITPAADHIRIGARATWTEVIRADLPRCFDGLKAAAREVGSVQIQNFGTVAGNLCNASPAADGVPPLLALDARVELASASGKRCLRLAEFLTGYRATARRPDEIVSAVLVPRGLEDAGSSFLKLGARRYLVISIVAVAAVVRVDEAGKVAEARIAVGSCSPVARRLPALEAALTGLPAERGLGSVAGPQHLAGLAPIDDIRATADYRRDAALTLVRRALDACLPLSDRQERP